MKRKHITTLLSNSRGEITTILTLAAMGLIVLGTLAVKTFQKNNQDTRVGAQNTSCISILGVSTDQENDAITSGKPFNCYVTTDQNKPTNIACALGNISQPGNVCFQPLGTDYGFKGYVNTIGETPNPSTNGKIAVFKCNTNNASLAAGYTTPTPFPAGTSLLMAFDFRITPIPQGPYCGSASGRSKNVTILPPSGSAPTSTVPTSTPPPGVATSTPIPVAPGGNACEVGYDLRYCTKTGGSCCSDWGVGIGCSNYDADRQFEYCRDNCGNSGNTNAQICQGYTPAVAATTIPSASPLPTPTTDPIACANGGIPCKDSAELVLTCGTSDQRKRFLDTCGEAWNNLYTCTGPIGFQTCTWNPKSPTPAEPAGVNTCLNTQNPEQVTICDNYSKNHPDLSPGASSNTPTPTPTSVPIPSISENTCDGVTEGDVCSAGRLAAIKITYTDPNDSTRQKRITENLFTNDEANKLSKICAKASGGISIDQNYCSTASPSYPSYLYGIFGLNIIKNIKIPDNKTGSYNYPCQDACTNPNTLNDCISPLADENVYLEYVRSLYREWNKDWNSWDGKIESLPNDWPDSWKKTATSCNSISKWK